MRLIAVQTPSAWALRAASMCWRVRVVLFVAAFAAAPRPVWSGAWSEGAPMPTCRSELAAAVLEGWIYVAGGLARNGASTAFERYRVDTDTWERRADLPAPLHHVAIAAWGAVLFISGGYQGDRFGSKRDGVWRYDPSADRWESAADMPAPRAAHAMVALPDGLYVVGGAGPGADQVWRYRPAQGNWDPAVTRLPTPREHLAAAAHEGRIIAVGGRWSGNLAAVERFDPSTGNWETLPALPTPRGGLTAAVVNGVLRVTGGEAFSPPRTFAEHEAFAFAGGSWRGEQPLPSARHGLASVSWNGRWYVIGGATGAAGETYTTATCRLDIFSP